MTDAKTLHQQLASDGRREWKQSLLDPDRVICAKVLEALDIVVGSVISYAIAIVASAALLWFFGRFDGVSLEIAVRQITVLALPASIGASAGRLLLQP